MIGLDTNVILRYIMQDDPKQSPKAAHHIESLSNDAPGYTIKRQYSQPAKHWSR
jgi:predicted nucleic-acid-binding protein